MHDRRAALILAPVALWALAAGASDPLVAEIQAALNELGFDAGAADGVAGGRTRLAIEAFQGEFGYPVDGAPDRSLLDRLKRAIAQGAASPERLLARSGLLRSYTRAVQEKLAALGYDPGPVDGVVGPRTRAAIRDYQIDHGLAGTGEVSRALLSHLHGLDGD